MQHKYLELEDIYLIISKNIKKYRLISGMTQKELAIKSGYSYSYIRKIESKNNIIKYTIEMIYTLAKVLNIDFIHLFDDNNI